MLGRQGYTYDCLNIKYHYKITISWWTEGENEHE